MDSAAMNSEMQALLAHSNWVQELARRLVRDPNVAEDLAQETMLAAIRDGQNTHRSVKAWLGTVLRNLVWERIRREDRRGAREVDVARDEAIASAGDLLDRMAAHKEVVEVLMTLPEGYRDVLLRRYFEGESPNRIATRLDIPQSTVRTRLSRGMAMMRERLDAEHGGDGRAWVVAVLPLVRAPRRAAELGQLTAQTQVLSMPVVIAGGLALFALAAVGWRALQREDAPQPALEMVGSLSTPEADSPASLPLSNRMPERFPSSKAVEVSTSSTRAARDSQAPVSNALRGRVVDLSGIGQSGVLIRFERYAGKGGEEVRGEGVSDPLSISGADGSFELQGAGSRGWVVAEREDLVTVLAGIPSVGGARNALVVVTAPRLEFAGRVLDQHGLPLPGVSLEIHPPADWSSGLGLDLEAAASVPFETVTGSDGAFGFDRAPALKDSTLSVELVGYESLQIELPNFTDRSLEIELLRLGSGAEVLRGEVVGPAGAPIAGAEVSDGRRRAICDDNGLFQFEYGSELPSQLAALAPGFQPALAEPEPAPLGEEPQWPDRIVLTLGPPPLKIHGRLVDRNGRGMRGVRVWASDLTVFWRPAKQKERETSTRIGLVPLARDSSLLLVEGVLGETESDHEGPWPYVHTDEDGGFVLRGLVDREYELGFLDARTLLHMRSAPIAAGDERAVVKWLPEPKRERVSGRVISTRGEALPGLRVGALVTGFRITVDDKQLYSEQLMSRSARTDPEGRFLLRDVPIDARLTVEGPNRPMVALDKVGERDSEWEYVLEVTPVTRLSVQLSEPFWANSFSAYDEDGKKVVFTVVEGPRQTSLSDAPLSAGGSGVLYVPLHAVSLKFRLGGELVREVPLQLDPRSLNHVRL